MKLNSRFPSQVLLSRNYLFLSIKGAESEFISIAGLGIGISLPSLDALITASIETEQRGTITSVYSGMRYAGVAIGPPLFALLLQYSVASLFLVASGLGLIAAGLVFILIRPPQKDV